MPATGGHGVNNVNGHIQPLIKSDKYYIPGGDLHLVVGDTRYRVHSYFFTRESLNFRNATSKSTASGVQGSSPACALVLHDVNPKKFDEFLWVFYNPSHSTYDASVETWASILRLANRWDFAEVKNLAIRELEKKDLNIVDRILIYQQQDVGFDLILPLYSELVSREAFISPEENVKLGDKTTVMILQARERLRTTPSNFSNGVSPLPAGVDASNARGIVESLLENFPPTSPLEVSLSSPLSPQVNGIHRTNGI